MPDNILGQEKMDEKNLNVLQQEIDSKLQEIKSLTLGLNKVERFSHHSKSIVTAFSLIGIAGAIRESSEQKKLQKFLNTPIYNGMDYESIARFIGKLSQQLVDVQADVQEQVPSDNPMYYGNVGSIAKALDDCYNAWYGISPAVADEELQTPSGGTGTLSSLTRYLIRKPFNGLDLPRQYEYMRV